MTAFPWRRKREEEIHLIPPISFSELQTIVETEFPVESLVFEFGIPCFHVSLPKEHKKAFERLVRKLKPYNLIHNHDVDTGKLYYRYPLIQFKSIKETPIVLAITNEALNVFKEIFMTINEVIIDKRKIPVYEKDFTPTSPFL